MRASDIVYEKLRAEIIDWVLPPGTAISEIETSERVGVSRTPLREALARLTAEGLVTSVGRTSRVTTLTREHVIELYELREALETQAVKFAARRRDPARFAELLAKFQCGAPDSDDPNERPYFLSGELDEAIDDAAGSRYIRAELDALRAQMARVRHNARTNTVRLDAAMREHILIVEAVLAGDESLAVHATAVHLHNSLANVLAVLPGLTEDSEPLP